MLEGEDLHEQLRFFVNDVVEGYVDAETAEGFPEDWNLERLWGALRALYPVSVTPEQLEEAAGGRSALTAEGLKEEVLSDAHHAYDEREAALGEEVMREVERRVMLSVLDRKWREHLYEMDYLQEGIGLRAMAQRDPLVEYQREGFLLWQAMNESVKEESVGLLFHVDVSVDAPQEEAPAVEPVHVSQMLGAMARCGRVAAARRTPSSRRSRPTPGARRARRRRWPTTAGTSRCRGSGWAGPRTGGPALLGAHRDRRGRGARRGRARGHAHRRAARVDAEERALPVRVGQEVQDVPRAALSRLGSADLEAR